MAESDGLAEAQPGLVLWGRVSSVISPTQFTCNNLGGKGDNFFFLWYVYVVRKADGSVLAPLHDYDGCLSYVSSTGLFTVTGLGFTAPLSVGDEIYLMHPNVSGRILNGLIVYSGSSPQNWNSGVATSGLAGDDLTTIGLVTADFMIHSLLVSIANLTPGANVTVRMYTDINGTNQEIYNQPFIQGTDPDGLWIINGTLGISSALRIEVYSDQAADDGAAVEYEYMRQS